MDALELAKTIQEAIQEDVFVEHSPTGEYDCALLRCTDEDGNTFHLKVTLQDAVEELSDIVPGSVDEDEEEDPFILGG